MTAAWGVTPQPFGIIKIFIPNEGRVSRPARKPLLAPCSSRLAGSAYFRRSFPSRRVAMIMAAVPNTAR
jgi:hypothetical protein